MSMELMSAKPATSPLGFSGKAGKNAVSSAATLPMQFAGKRMADIPTATLQAYAPGKPKFGAGIRFGGSGTGLDIQEFKRAAKNQVTRPWENAVHHSRTEQVSTEDWLLHLLQDFQADLTKYEAKKDSGKPFFSQSYLGKELGMDRSVGFLERYNGSSKQENIDLALRELTEHLDSTATGKSSAEADVVRSKYPTPELQAIFETASDFAKRAGGDLIEAESVLQVIAMQNGTVGAKVAKMLMGDVGIRPDRDVKSLMGDDMAAPSSSNVVDLGDPATGLNLSELVKTPQFLPYPVQADDVQSAIKLMKHGQRSLILNLPAGADRDRAVDTIAARAAQDLPDGKQAKFFRIDLDKFIRHANEMEPGLQQNEIWSRLRQQIQKLVADNRNIVLHLKGVEGILAASSASDLSNLFRDLNVNGRSRLILTPETRAVSEDDTKAAKAASNAAQLEGFATLAFERGPVSELAAFLSAPIAALQAEYPEVKFTPDGINQALLMASRTGESLPDTTLEALRLTAERLIETAPPEHLESEDAAPLPADKQAVEKAVLADPHFDYATKAARAGSYRVMDSDEIGHALTGTLPIVGWTDAADFFGDLKTGLEGKDEGTLDRAALLFGPQGTAKTDFVLRFAQENDLPVVYLPARELAATGQPQKMADVVRQAFAAAKSRSQKLEAQGKPAQVIVFADNLEHGWSSEGKNPMLETFLQEVEKLNAAGNRKIISLAAASDAKTAAFVGESPLAKNLDRVVQTQVPLYVNERAHILRAAGEDIEQRIGQPVFAELGDEAYQDAAQMLSGLSGGGLRQLMEKALEKTRQRGAERANHKDLVDAAQELSTPQARQSLNLHSQETARQTAFHQAGQAVTAAFMKRILNHNGPDVRQLTLVPEQTVALDRADTGKKELISKLVSALSSSASEVIAGGELTARHTDDLRQAKGIVTRMLNEYGMGSNLLEHPDPFSNPKLIAESQNYLKVSQRVAEIILEEAAPLLNELVDTIAGTNGDIGVETMTGAQFKAYVESFVKENPKVAERMRTRVLYTLVDQGVLTEGYKIKLPLFGKPRVEEVGPRLGRSGKEGV